MKVIVHDFSGHPFQAELSRKLADRGHEVDHVVGRAVRQRQGSSRGAARRQPHAVVHRHHPRPAVPEVRAAGPAPLRAGVRARVDRPAQGRTGRRHHRVQPAAGLDVPVRPPRQARRSCRRSCGTRTSTAPACPTSCAASSPGRSHGSARGCSSGMEAYCARHARHVVAIGDAFKEVYPGWKVAPENVSVIPNWAPLDKVFPVDRNNRTLGRPVRRRRLAAPGLCRHDRPQAQPEAAGRPAAQRARQRHRRRRWS